MRKVPYVEPTSEEWNAWREKAKATIEALVRDFEHGKKPEIDKNIYAERKHDIIRNFHGKCAYCESRIVAIDAEGMTSPQTQPGEVEHFRPKGCVTDENKTQIHYNHEEKEFPHPGYYWLAYEWSNLLLACETCNRPSKTEELVRIGKWDMFPVTRRGEESGHAVFPGDEKHESPLLINPYEEDYDPDKHFTFRKKTGFLKPKSERAEMCIEIFQLNGRGFPEARKKVYRDILMNYKRVIKRGQQGKLAKDAKTDIQKASEGKEPYTFAALAAIRDAKEEIKRKIQRMSEFLEETPVGRE